MITQTAEVTLGCGTAIGRVSSDEMRAIVEEALEPIPAGARVLAVIPDKTRDDNTDVLFPMAAQILQGRRVAAFDALVAQGTHTPMTKSEKMAKIGGEGLAGVGEVFDHRWDDPEEISMIGALSADQVTNLTGGAFQESVPVSINRLIASGEYDFILLFTATVPHEVVGFAGGAKYFFPGVAGPELTHVTHWLGALVTVEHTIGRIETPPRLVIEAAADLIRAQVICFSSVVSRSDEGLCTHALFAGDFRSAFRRAAAVSRQVHIKYTGRKYRRVIALLDEHYDDLWVGGKASYRLGGVIEEGGELIIYAPHMKKVSETHGALIEKYGYAPLEVVREMMENSEELRRNLCVAAHLTHVSFASRRDEEGRIVPRYKITLASGIDRATCERIKLGYLDWKEFKTDAFLNDPDTLIVERAGRDLYLPEAFID